MSGNGGFSAVIFDSDGVLVDSEILGMEIELKALADIGLDYDPTEFQLRFMGMTDKVFMELLEDDMKTRHGRSLPDDFEDKVLSTKEAVYRDRLRPVPGIGALVEALPHPKAVASSATIDDLKRNLELTGLYDLLSPHVYSGQLVRRSKPEPDVYLYAAEKLVVSPENCLVIEDSVNGVKAGLAAGMTVWGFIGGGHADDALGVRLSAAGAHNVFSSHEEIRAELVT